MQTNYDVQIGPYKLQKTLGIGSFGKVKRALRWRFAALLPAD